MPLNRTNPDSARQIIEHLLPDARAHRSALAFLAGAIRQAHALWPERWGVTLKADMVRLNVGRIETLTIVEGCVHVVFDDEYRPFELRSGPGVRWSERGRTVYNSVPGSCYCNIDIERFAALRPRLVTSHKLLLFRAADTSINPETRVGHSPGVLRYLEKTLRTVLPDPAYWQPDRVPDVDEALLANKGARAFWRAHLRTERDRYTVWSIRKHVLRQTGKLECEACGLDLARAYGPKSEDVSEIHLRITLDRFEAGEYPSLEDYAILCPNCHRVIHRIDPMPAVEDFKAMLPRREGP